MQKTIFTTPLVSPLFKWLSNSVLKLSGWQVLGQVPTHAQKSVLIAAPHTSNWDLPMTLMVAFALELGRHPGGPQPIEQLGGQQRPSHSRCD